LCLPLCKLTLFNTADQHS